MTRYDQDRMATDAARKAAIATFRPLSYAALDAEVTLARGARMASLVLLSAHYRHLSTHGQV